MLSMNIVYVGIPETITDKQLANGTDSRFDAIHIPYEAAEETSCSYLGLLISLLPSV